MKLTIKERLQLKKLLPKQGRTIEEAERLLSLKKIELTDEESKQINKDRAKLKLKGLHTENIETIPNPEVESNIKFTKEDLDFLKTYFRRLGVYNPYHVELIKKFL